MKFLTLSKFLLIIILPFLLFLFMLNFFGFDNLCYKEKFSEYGVQQNVPNAVSLHEKVINFIKGEDNQLPNDFNEKEKQHLLDVRNAIDFSTMLLYIFIILFVLLLIASAFALKVNNYIVNFVGKILVFGGFLTIILAGILFLLISTDFPTTFESFHSLLFEKGTYVFDPTKEVIVNLYPEQLFLDLGLRISKNVFFGSAVLIIIGLFLILKSKSKKNKNKQK